jgi:hypothetical protein
MSVVSKEQALKEVNEWLDFKQVSFRKRAKVQENIERIAEAIEDGILVLDPTTKVFTQQLKFPFGEEVKIETLRFKPLLEVRDIQSKLSGVPADDGYGRAFAHIAAATGEDRNVIGKMNYEDYSLAGDLVIFFML